MLGAGVLVVEVCRFHVADKLRLKKASIVSVSVRSSYETTDSIQGVSCVRTFFAIAGLVSSEMRDYML
jgi:hypothetical protein